MNYHKLRGWKQDPFIVSQFLGAGSPHSWLSVPKSRPKSSRRPSWTLVRGEGALEESASRVPHLVGSVPVLVAAGLMPQHLCWLSAGHHAQLLRAFRIPSHVVLFTFKARGQWDFKPSRSFNPELNWFGQAHGDHLPVVRSMYLGPYFHLQKPFTAVTALGVDWITRRRGSWEEGSIFRILPTTQWACKWISQEWEDTNRSVKERMHSQIIWGNAGLSRVKPVLLAGFSLQDIVRFPAMIPDIPHNPVWDTIIWF